MRKEKKALTILIVDDNEKDLILLESMLLQLGFRKILKALGGEEGIIMASGHLPDLIFLDIMMPDMSGGVVREYLINNPETKDIPTIFLTSIIKKSEQKDIGQLSGGNIIIAKPYSSKELSEVIEKTFVNSPNDSKNSFNETS